MGLIPLLVGDGGLTPILPNALPNGTYWMQGGLDPDGSITNLPGNAWYDKYTGTRNFFGLGTKSLVSKNGHQIISLGVNSAYRNNSLADFNQDFTFICAFKSGVASASNPGLFETEDTTTANKRFYLRDLNVSGLTVIISDNTGAQNITVNTLINAFNRDVIITVKMDSTLKKITIYLDGATFEGSNGAFVNPVKYNGTCQQTFGSLKSNCTTFGSYSQSDLYEFVVYSDLKTVDECNGVMKYISDRYNIAFTPS